MEIFAVVIKFFLAVALAVFGTMKGNELIDNLYQVADSRLLSFPYQLKARSAIRRKILPCVLATVFCLTLMNHEFTIATTLSLIMEYILVLMTFTDFEQYVLFDAMVLPLAIIGVVAAIVSGAPLDHLAAALGGALGFLLMALVTRGAIGGGDIKLIGALGLWLGSVALCKVVIIGLIAGGIIAGILMLKGIKKRGDFFAYGPYFTIVTILMAMFY